MGKTAEFDYDNDRTKKASQWEQRRKETNAENKGGLQENSPPQGGKKP